MKRWMEKGVTVFVVMFCMINLPLWAVSKPGTAPSGSKKSPTKIVSDGPATSKQPQKVQEDTQPVPATTQKAPVFTHTVPAFFSKGQSLTLTISAEGLPANAQGYIHFKAPVNDQENKLRLAKNGNVYTMVLRPDILANGPLLYFFTFSVNQDGISQNHSYGNGKELYFTVNGKGKDYVVPVDPNKPQTEKDIQAEMAMLQPGSKDFPRLDLSVGAWIDASVTTKKPMPGWYFYLATKTPSSGGIVYHDLYRINSTQNSDVINWVDILSPGSSYYFIAQKEWNGKNYTVEMKDTNTYRIQVSPVKRNQDNSIVEEEKPKVSKLKDWSSIVEPVFPKSYSWSGPLDLGARLKARGKAVFLTVYVRRQGELQFTPVVIDMTDNSSLQKITLPDTLTLCDSIEYYYEVSVMKNMNSRDKSTAVIDNKGKPWKIKAKDAPPLGPSVKANNIVDYFQGGRTLQEVPFRLVTKSLPSGYQAYVVVNEHPFLGIAYLMKSSGNGVFEYQHAVKGITWGQTQQFYYIIKDENGRQMYSSVDSIGGNFEYKLVQRLLPFQP